MERLARALEIAVVVIVFGVGIFIYRASTLWWFLALFIIAITDNRIKK